MTDITARQLQTKISDLWGQSVIVDNRAGASGNIALELAGRSAPDGYTLFVGNVSTNAINETTFKSLKVKPSRDLTCGEDHAEPRDEGLTLEGIHVGGGQQGPGGIPAVRAAGDQGLGKDRRREQYQGRMKDAYRVLHK